MSHHIFRLLEKSAERALKLRNMTVLTDRLEGFYIPYLHSLFPSFSKKNKEKGHKKLSDF